MPYGIPKLQLPSWLKSNWLVDGRWITEGELYGHSGDCAYHYTGCRKLYFFPDGIPRLLEANAVNNAQEESWSEIQRINDEIQRISDRSYSSSQPLSDEKILATVERATIERERREQQQQQQADIERRRKFNAFYDCKIISHDSSTWTPSCPEDIGEIELFPVGKIFPVDKTREGFLYVKSERVIAKIKRQGLQLLNGDACGFLREHQDSIPKKWRKFSKIIFWGTVFEEWIKIDRSGESIKIPAVHGLRFFDQEWIEDYHGCNDPFLRSGGERGTCKGDAIAVKKV